MRPALPFFVRELGFEVCEIKGQELDQGIYEALIVRGGDGPRSAGHSNSRPSSISMVIWGVQG